MRAVERAALIVLALRRDDRSEEEASAFLAEHDAEVREAALAEGVGLLRRQAARRLRRPEHSAGLRQGAALLHRLADRPAPEIGPEPGEPAFFQPGHHYTTGRTLFRCIALDLHPVTGEVYAIGWYRDRIEALSLDDYDQLGWNDITEVTP